MQLRGISGRWGLWALVCVLFMGIICPAHAAIGEAGGEFADIRANSAVFEEPRDLVMLSGDVELRLEDIVLFADEVTYYKGRNVAQASGSVSLDIEGRTIRGESVTVDGQDQSFWMEEGKGQSEVKGAQGPLYFTGESIHGDRHRVIVERARVTSCGSSCKRDEYHLRAKRITIYPDSKIVAKKVALYIGSERVMYFPLLVLSLKEKPDIIPKIGWNKDDGFYFKIKYLYLAKEAVLGYLIFDYLEKKGQQMGAQHEWQSKIGKGSLIWKQLADKRTSRQDTNINFSQALSISSKIQGNTTYAKNQSTNQLFNARTDNRSWRLDLARRAGQSSLTFSLAEQGNYATQASKTRNTLLSFNKPINKSIRFSTQWSLAETTFGGQPNNQDLRGEYSIDYDQRIFSLRARFTQYHDVDGDSYPGPDATGAPRLENTPYENLKPELFLTFKQPVMQWFGLKWLPMSQLTVRRVSREREATSSLYSGSETEVNTAWNARRNLMGASTVLTFNQTIRQLLYATGDANFNSNINFTLDKKFSASWNLNATYQESELEGGVPQQGAQRNSSQRVLGTLSQNRGPWQFRMTTGFDYRLDFYQPLGLNLNRRMGPASTFSVSTTRDLQSKRWSPITANFASSQGTRRISSAITYGLGPGRLQNWITRVERSFKGVWSLGTTFVHGRQTKQRLLQDIIVRKANCCTQLQFAYRPKEKDFQMLYLINAFPGKSLTFSATDGNLDLGTNLFDRFVQGSPSGGFSN